MWFDPGGAAPGPPRRRLLLYDDTPESRMDDFARFERLMARASRLGAAASREARNRFDGRGSAALRGTALPLVQGGASARV